MAICDPADHPIAFGPRFHIVSPIGDVRLGFEVVDIGPPPGILAAPVKPRRVDGNHLPDVPDPPEADPMHYEWFRTLKTRAFEGCTHAS
jgi:hypothetical protein